MLIEFEERVDLHAADVYPYFKSPRDWPRLYGSFGEAEDRGGGWYAVPLKSFPFPLVARVTHDEPNKAVSWSFRGFWRGEGHVSFEPSPGGVVIRGHERISVRPAGFLSPVLERMFLERSFRKLWESGWRRLRRQGSAAAAS